MKWHNKKITKRIIGLVLAIPLTLLMIVMLIVGISQDNSSGIILFAFLSIFMGFATWSNIKDLTDLIQEQHNAAVAESLPEFKQINPYKTHEQMVAVYNTQRHIVLYKDKKIFITPDFIVTQSGRKLFLIDGVLDVIPFVQKTNGIVSHISLNILYYDGKRYEFRQNHPFGVVTDMQEEIKGICYAANIIANKSKNYAKFPNYKL